MLPKLKANVDAGQGSQESTPKGYDRTQRDQGKNQLYGNNSSARRQGAHGGTD